MAVARRLENVVSLFCAVNMTRDIENFDQISILLKGVTGNGD